MMMIFAPSIGRDKCNIHFKNIIIFEFKYQNIATYPYLSITQTKAAISNEPD
jgi:hypothetical protein